MLARPFTAELQRLGVAPGRSGAVGPAASLGDGLALPAPGPAMGADLAGEMMATLERIERRLAGLAPAAVAGLEEEGPERKGPAAAEIAMELEDMRARVLQTQIEIAALRHPLAEHDRLVVAGEELAAIVKATEQATNSLLTDAEAVDRAAAAILAGAGDPAVAERAAEIRDAVVRIFEACNFQDITGQRIGKVVRTLGFIEERVAAMIQVWGEETFQDLPRPEEVTGNEEAKLLNGPQIEGRAISQAEIDALFG
jgi:chemotaxis protein CheZ